MNSVYSELSDIDGERRDVSCMNITLKKNMFVHMTSCMESKGLREYGPS